MRAIAANAGVDVALVSHYFGSKDQLFLQANSLPLRPAELVAQLLHGDPQAMGDRLIRRLLEVLEASPGGGPMVGLLRSATNHDGAARMIREFFTSEVVGRLARSMKVSQPDLRAALCVSQLMGLMLARFVVQVEPLKSASAERLAAWYGPTFQRYLTGDL